MHSQWAKSLRDQCAVSLVPFFFKQWGEFAPDMKTRRTLHPQMIRVGKKAAGRLLDGIEHNAMPEMRA
jgi:protein gp37